MRLAITGASGFIGRQVVHEALQQGHSVLAIIRSEDKRAQLPVNPALTTLCCDLNHVEVLEAHLKTWDAVIHLAAVISGPDQYRQTMETTRALLTGMDAAGVTRLVAISSIAVIDYTRLPAHAMLPRTHRSM